MKNKIFSILFLSVFSLGCFNPVSGVIISKSTYKIKSAYGKTVFINLIGFFHEGDVSEEMDSPEYLEFLEEVIEVQKDRVCWSGGEKVPFLIELSEIAIKNEFVRDKFNFFECQIGRKYLSNGLTDKHFVVFEAIDDVRGEEVQFLRSWLKDDSRETIERVFKFFPTVESLTKLIKSIGNAIDRLENELEKFGKFGLFEIEDEKKLFLEIAKDLSNFRRKRISESEILFRLKEKYGFFRHLRAVSINFQNILNLCIDSGKINFNLFLRDDIKTNFDESFKHFLGDLGLIYNLLKWINDKRVRNIYLCSGQTHSVNLGRMIIEMGGEKVGESVGYSGFFEEGAVEGCLKVIKPSCFKRLIEKGLSFFDGIDCCDFCRKSEGLDLEERLKVCARCRNAKYCSRQCQVKDWKEGGHKKACGKTKK